MSLDVFGEERRTSDRSGAASAEEARFDDARIFDAGGEAENVTADGIADFNGSSGVWEFTCVARVAEMIEKKFTEHWAH